MKPTPQISSKQRQSHGHDHALSSQAPFPSLDYNFQSTVDAVDSATAIGAKFIKLDTFRKESSEFLTTETHRDFFAEFVFFAFVTGISAWSICSAGVAMFRMLRGW